MAPQLGVQPSLDTIREVLAAAVNSPNPPNLVPIFSSIPAEFLTPSSIYLKISAKSVLGITFSWATAEDKLLDPRKVIKTGPGHGEETDPLPLLEKELAKSRVATVPSIQLPPMTGGAVGYVGYDCVKYFEPKTRRDDVKDVLGVPESFFMLFDTLVALDHFAQVVKVITYVKVPDSLDNLEQAYEEAKNTLKRYVTILKDENIPLPEQGPIQLGNQYTSNIGQEGYENHVKELKKHISVGDIIQAVPSQRFARPTSLHPFNIYRNLRNVNPSPYLFFVDCDDFQIVGASPELLVKEEQGRIITHPIAGTVKRGKTLQEDAALADELSNSLKDRAEHVMLVDLARNDVNRVCDPLSTRVDKLMVVQKHLVSEVSGVLRPGKTRFDAFRSIFPAGTVSGAPKVRAMELIAELEKEKRGVYAGAVGYFGYGSVDGDKEIEGAMDTCIALRTMLVKDGIAYLQAGGGIVFDSDPYDEWMETINKLGAPAAPAAPADSDIGRLELVGVTTSGYIIGKLLPQHPIPPPPPVKMKSFAILAAVAGAALAQDIPMPSGECAIAESEFQCDDSDIACFCTRSNWAFGIRDCTREACDNQQSASAIEWAYARCVGVAATASGTPDALPILTSAVASATNVSPSSTGDNDDDNDVTSTIVQTGSSILSAASSLVTSVITSIESDASSVASDVNSLTSSIGDEASSALSSAESAVSSVLSSVESAIESATNTDGGAEGTAEPTSTDGEGAAPRVTGMSFAAGAGIAAWLLL
ncbi:anthranilate synthase component i [Stemphylium lycopersici]|uniref:Anthranilate synthase-like protein component I n=1 Tax=Stemphylium lycopersici TaxID=183478 RepID=A0A364N1Q7_STELY|nr:anthranilate synthase component i [Stemphylium lycopersici]RAR09472.1 anthranilate synthase-like protein component I [Stemphylium lycopersici]